MMRAEAIRDTATDHEHGIHHIDRSDEVHHNVPDPPYAGREQHLKRYAAYRLRRRRSEKTNSTAGVVLSILTVLLITQVSFQSKREPTNWLDTEPSELIIDEFVELVRVPPAQPPTPDATPAASSRPEATPRPTTENVVALNEDRPEEQADTEESEELAEHTPSRALDLAPAPAINPQAIQLEDSTALMASSIQIRPTPDMPSDDGLDRPPQLIVESLYLRYPWEALKRGVQGLVVLHFFVDSRGRTSSVRVLSSSCPPCEESAVKALQKARFRPAKHNGKRIGTYSKLAVRFVLR